MYHPRISRKTSPSFGQTCIIQQSTPVKRYPPLSNVVQRAQQDPSSVTGDEWQQLQLAIGYRATKGLRSGEKTDWKPKFKGISALYAEQAGQKLPVQAKLVIGQPNDKYEQEADRVAGEVVQQINTPTFIQLTSESLQPQPETESEIQTKPETITIRRSPAPKLQREAVAGGEASTDLTTAINSARGSGQPLDPKLQASMGQAMGADFSRVRIHNDAKSDRLNQSIQAKAFTTGQDVFFRQGEYQPGSRKGQETIAHELTHVVQQNQNQKQQKAYVSLEDRRGHKTVRRIKLKGGDNRLAGIKYVSTFDEQKEITHDLGVITVAKKRGDWHSLWYGHSIIYLEWLDNIRIRNGVLLDLQIQQQQQEFRIDVINQDNPVRIISDIPKEPDRNDYEYRTYRIRTSKCKKALAKAQLWHTKAQKEKGKVNYKFLENGNNRDEAVYFNCATFAKAILEEAGLRVDDMPRTTPQGLLDNTHQDM